jgi:hypothetical protein
MAPERVSGRPDRAAEFSTFRLTLAAILRPVLAMASEDDPKLTAWMHARLRVVTVPVPDAAISARSRPACTTSWTRR